MINTMIEKEEVSITCLPTEIIYHIFIYLSPIDIIKSISLCNKHFYNIITSSKTSKSHHHERSSLSNSDGFWRLKYARNMFYLYPTTKESSLLQRKKDPSVFLSIKQIQQCCIVANKRKEMTEIKEDTWFQLDTINHQNTIFRILHDNGNCNNHKNMLTPRNLRIQDALSSSMDRRDEKISNTINHDFKWIDIFNHNGATNSSGGDDDATNYLLLSSMISKWWSSASSTLSSPKDTNEILLFTTEKKSIITEVAIKPLKDPYVYQAVYSWPQISIQIYLLPPLQHQNNNTDNEHEKIFNSDIILNGNIHNQRPLIQDLLHHCTPTYESPIMDAKSLDQTWQWYKIPDGVVGNVVTFTLWGKTSEQITGLGYYVCVDWVAIRGVPLVLV